MALPENKSAYWADFNTLPALHAPRLGKGQIFKGGDRSLETPSCKADGSNAQTVLTDPHAFPTEDTLVWIVGKDGGALIGGEVSLEFSESFWL